MSREKRVQVELGDYSGLLFVRCAVVSGVSDRDRTERAAPGGDGWEVEKRRDEYRGRMMGQMSMM